LTDGANFFTIQVGENAMLLYYIRHADPIYRPDSITEFGKTQADALAKRLKIHGFDEIYSSSSIRAQMTAEPTLKALDKSFDDVFTWACEDCLWQTLTVPREDDPSRVDWAFRSGKYPEMLNSDEIRQMGFDWHTHTDFKDFKFGEGILTFNKACDEFFLSLGYRHDLKRHCFIAEKPNDKRVAFFAHQGIGLAFLSNILDIPYSIFATHFDLGHSSVTVVEFKEKNGLVIPRVLQVSNDSHLYKEGVSTKYQNEIDI